MPLDWLKIAALSFLLGVAAAGCGHTKFPPTTDCAIACAQAGAGCGGLDQGACVEACDRIESHRPGYAACIATSVDCFAATMCDQ